jgi:hypothetical protein
MTSRDCNFDLGWETETPLNLPHCSSVKLPTEDMTTREYVLYCVKNVKRLETRVKQNLRTIKEYICSRQN